MLICITYQVHSVNNYVFQINTCKADLGISLMETDPVKLGSPSSSGSRSLLLSTDLDPIQLEKKLTDPIACSSPGSRSTARIKIYSLLLEVNHPEELFLLNTEVLILHQDPESLVVQQSQLLLLL